MLAKTVSVLLCFFQAQFYPQIGRPAVTPVDAADVTAADQQVMQPVNRHMSVWMIAFSFHMMKHIESKVDI